jgi:riboflavin transporter FmnP
MPMRLTTRELTFTAVMAALANVLAMVSIGLTRVGQIGLDFSNLAVFIGGIYGGPILGFMIGLLGGVVPGIMFGPLGGLGWLGLFGLTLGKSLTGLTVGFVSSKLGVSRKTGVRSVASVLIAYIPESLFTVYFFLSLVPLFLGAVPWLSFGWLISIAAKGWLETVIIAVFIAALMRNAGFTNLVVNILGHVWSPLCEDVENG